MDWYRMHRVVVSVSVHLHKSWLIWLCVEKYEWYWWIDMHLWEMSWAWLICHMIDVWFVSAMFGIWVVRWYACGENKCVCEWLCYYILVCNYIIILFLTLLLFGWCSMRHCRLDVGGLFVKLRSSYFCRSALICSTG